jgi:hypothetical protein
MDRAPDPREKRPVAAEPIHRGGSPEVRPRDFSAMPILADALQDPGCGNVDILDPCRGPGPHVRGCRVVHFVLGNE